MEKYRLVGFCIVLFTARVAIGPHGNAVATIFRAGTLEGAPAPGNIRGEAPGGEVKCEDEDGIPIAGLLGMCSSNFRIIAHNANATEPGGTNGGRYVGILAGDLVFQTSRTQTSSDFDRAVARSGGVTDSVIHVGIFCSPDMVIEASDYGVRKIGICEFFESAGNIVIMRVNDESIVPSSLERAEGFIGRPYNLSFHQDSYGFYCSQLITESFLKPNGSRYFALHILKFDDEEYWAEYYGELNLSVPDNMFGSHPQQLMDQKELLTPIVELRRK
jgi:hypothetical protein